MHYCPKSSTDAWDIDGTWNVVLKSNLLFFMGSALCVLLSTALVILSVFILLLNADASLNLESVGTAVFTCIIFSGTSGFFTTVDCIDTVQLVSDLLLFSTGPCVWSSFILASSTGTEVTAASISKVAFIFPANIWLTTSLSSILFQSVLLILFTFLNLSTGDWLSFSR